MAVSAEFMLTPAVASSAAAVPARAMAEHDLLEATVREHARLVYRIAFSVLRSPEDAEDATQEVFVRVLGQRRKLSTVEDRRAWLARIAWRVAVDRRRTHREVPLEADEAASVVRKLCDAGADVERIAADRQMMRLVEELIAALPGELREVTVFSTVDELSSREVAAALGIPEATARTRLFRARQLLREKLERALRPVGKAGG